MSFSLKIPSWVRKQVTALMRRFRISENTFMAVLAVIIGLLAGLLNYGFRQTIDLIHHLVYVQGMGALDISFEHWSLSRLLIVFFPMVGALLLLPLGIFFAKDLKFGFSSFLERVNLRGGKLPGRNILTRGLACAVTLGTGGSAGPEGPIAQIGGGVGSQIGQLFKMRSDSLKTIVACGVSGGVAATFNAPIAGVFFAHEIVLLSSFQLSSFTSIVIASGMSTVVSRALLGDHPAFLVPPYLVSSSWELIFYVILGVVIGMVAAGFIDIHFRIKDRFAALKIHRLLKPALGCFLLGLMAIAFPQVLGDGYEFIEEVLYGGGHWSLLMALILLKILATSVTLGSGMPGGLFAPSMYIGAMTGGAFGKLLQMLFPAMAISPGAYALVGMGAFLSAATHAPMTAIFLLFEMTASYQVIIPIMLTCVIGTAICRRFKQHSLETFELARAGIDLEAGKERNIMKSLKVGDVMARDLETVPESMTLRQFTDFVASTHHTNFPLVDAYGALTGIISVQDFMGVVFEPDLMDLVVVKELATTRVITVCPEEDLDQAMRKVGYRNIEQLPVVEGDGGKLVGIISRRDIISAYNRALMNRSFEESES